MFLTGILLATISSSDSLLHLNLLAFPLRLAHAHGSRFSVGVAIHIGASTSLEASNIGDSSSGRSGSDS